MEETNLFPYSKKEEEKKQAKPTQSEGKALLVVCGVGVGGSKEARGSRQGVALF